MAFELRPCKTKMFGLDNREEAFECFPIATPRLEHDEVFTQKEY